MYSCTSCGVTHGKTGHAWYISQPFRVFIHRKCVKKSPLKGFHTKYANGACIMVGHAVFKKHKINSSYMLNAIMQLYVMTLPTPEG